jgi:aspartyl-tRNA synthetase
MAEAIHRFEEAAMWIRVVSAESCRGFAFKTISVGAPLHARITIGIERLCSLSFNASEKVIDSP